ncbi:hypothetical protein Tco_1488548, partial [Tanacetum coccineum]
VKGKPHGGRGSPRKWLTKDMITAAKHGDKVFHVQPVSEFNPTTGIQVVNKVLDVAVKPTDVVKGKL